MKLIYTHKHIHARVYIFNSKKCDATRLAKGSTVCCAYYGGSKTPDPAYSLFGIHISINLP
jgi:hypothetical protein